MFIQETLTGMSSSLPKITISFESFNLCLFDNFFFLHADHSSRNTHAEQVGKVCLPKC